MRKSTASAPPPTSSPSVRKRSVRSPNRGESEARPGVSMRVSRSSRGLGSRTSTRSTSSGCSPPRSTRSAASPPRRSSGTRPSPLARPERSQAVASGSSPCTYQVTTLVHSPASVGATGTPTSALSRVDLPALTRPARATRSGESPSSAAVRSRASHGRPR